MNGNEKAHRLGGGLRDMPSSVLLDYAHEAPPREKSRQGHQLCCIEDRRMVRKYLVPGWIRQARACRGAADRCRIRA